jgi:AraC-like DNA-binding protein
MHRGPGIRGTFRAPCDGTSRIRELEYRPGGPATPRSGEPGRHTFEVTALRAGRLAGVGPPAALVELFDGLQVAGGAEQDDPSRLDAPALALDVERRLRLRALEPLEVVLSGAEPRRVELSGGVGCAVQARGREPPARLVQLVLSGAHELELPREELLRRGLGVGAEVADRRERETEGTHDDAGRSRPRGNPLEQRDRGILVRVKPVPAARHLLRAKDLIDARYRDPLDVPTLARAAHLSPAHFSRAFRDTFGETPHQYLLTRRLERAAALLRNTDRAVADICLTVGLRSVGSFTTSFGRRFGRTPTAYRAAFPPASTRIRVPTCMIQRWGRPGKSSFREDVPAARE